MFTGIIEELGTLKKVQRGQQSSVLTISGEKIFEDLDLGDSVAVNGVCLTVTSLDRNSFMADVMPQTLAQSSLGVLKQGSKVNLERALLAKGRFGGHMVSGHIDGCGTIACIKQDDNAFWYTVKTTEQILRYIVPKGSVALDGISLTVAELNSQDFSVSIIPHTAQMTTLSQKKVGDIINIENDLIGKYIEKILSLQIAEAPARQPKEITLEFLAQNGF